VAGHQPGIRLPARCLLEQRVAEDTVLQVSLAGALKRAIQLLSRALHCFAAGVGVGPVGIAHLQRHDSIPAA
jgi:hypothetical protein